MAIVTNAELPAVEMPWALWKTTVGGRKPFSPGARLLVGLKLLL